MAHSAVTECACDHAIPRDGRRARSSRTPCSIFAQRQDAQVLPPPPPSRTFKALSTGNNFAPDLVHPRNPPKTSIHASFYLPIHVRRASFACYPILITPNPGRPRLARGVATYYLWPLLFASLPICRLRQLCVAHCHEEGAAYAATQYGYECWCYVTGRSDFDRHGTEEDEDGAVCETPCAGNEVCMYGTRYVCMVHRSRFFLKD